MLNAGGDNMIALAAQCEERGFERQVVRFAPAAGEDDFILAAAEQLRNITSGGFECGFGPDRCPMAVRRIAKMAVQKGLHRGGDCGIDRRAGVVVEIDVHIQNTGTLSASAVA